jgi:hypothetical protein
MMPHPRRLSNSELWRSTFGARFSRGAQPDGEERFCGPFPGRQRPENDANRANEAVPHADFGLTPRKSLVDLPEFLGSVYRAAGPDAEDSDKETSHGQ